MSKTFVTANSSRSYRFFVGGLPASISPQDIVDSFSRFGDVSDVDIIVDKKTGNSKGFGFFCLSNCTKSDIFREKHCVCDKRVDIDEVTDLKIFVGGLTEECSPEDLAEYFEKFGPVVETEIPVDADGNSRGFGFVIFEDQYGMNETLNQASHLVCGRLVDIRKAEPRRKNMNRSGNFGFAPQFGKGYGKGFGKGGFNPNYFNGGKHFGGKKKGGWKGSAGGYDRENGYSAQHQQYQ